MRGLEILEPSRLGVATPFAPTEISSDSGKKHVGQKINIGAGIIDRWA